MLDTPVANTFTEPNSGVWYRFSAISGVVYTARQVPSRAKLSVLNDQANLLASGAGGSLS